VLTVDGVAHRLLSDLVERPGLHRAGLALTEGGGRRLRFTASDRISDGPDGPDGQVQWCHIDAYDDVPLTMVVRTRERVAGLLSAMQPLFPGYVDHLADGPTVALIAVPLLAHGQVLGGLVVFCDDAASFGAPLRDRLTALADQVTDDLRRAQLRSPRDSARLGDEPVADGAVVHDCEVEGDPRAVGTARRFLRRAIEDLEDPRLDDDLVDTAVLCLSEIVTNAVIHTGAPSELRIVVEDGVLTVTVRDEGNHRGTRPGAGPDDDPLRVHGRGLQLVDALSARWGSELDEVGTTVWFCLEPR
jgi:anti-sigma regulatory factor (Ser/Thr protein kinase)